MTEDRKKRPLIIVRGAGDLATGILVRLHRCGFRLLMLECTDPSAIRRKAALCEAVRLGSYEVEGVRAVCVGGIPEMQAVWDREEIPLLVDESAACCGELHPAVLVDAILAKRNLGTVRSMAPITVGVGPGFTAGEDVDAVVETMRGHHLGRVYLSGSAIPNTGVPGNIGGYTSERVIHAPGDGPMCFVSGVDIGSLVTRGQVIGYTGDTPVLATLDGVLRGLIREGYPVKRGLKIADIDPRPEQVKYCDTVSDKARSIGGGVLEAILQLSAEKGIAVL